MKLTLVKNNNPEDRLSAMGQIIPPSGIREFFDIVYSTPDCISLGVGEPDFATPWNISDYGIYSIKDGNTHYTPNRGLPELCKAIAGYLSDNYRLTYDPAAELLVTLGVSQGLDLALRSIIDPGDEIIIFEPCYVSYAANVTMLHGKPVIISTTSGNGFKIDMEELQRAITPKTKAILLNYPANPTGASIDKNTLEKIAHIAIDNNLIVISDEIYSAIVYDVEHFSIAAVPGMKERTIYLNGFSKSHAMTGWRIGFIAAPAYVMKVAIKIHQYTALCAPTMAQYAAVEALAKGAKEVARMNREYTKRKNYIVNRFNEIGLTCHNPGGAFYVFPDVSSTGKTGREFALQLLEKEKVAVVPGDAFGKTSGNNIRCSFATSIENIKEALNRIERFVKNA